MKLLPISVVVLTYNEENDLPGCLSNLATFSDDIHVIDSGSADRTLEIARQFAAKVYVNPFEGFGSQRNWAIERADLTYDLVLHLDADERVTPAFVDELAQICEKRENVPGWQVPSKMILQGQWLRYSVGYPVYQVRLHYRDRLRFENYGHGQREISREPMGRMHEPYLHYGFSKGLEAWLTKHVHYAKKEAHQAKVGTGAVWEGLGGIFASDLVIRRRALKRLSFRLPFRATLRFWHILLWKWGFLDGPAGWQYARMISCYESMIEIFSSTSLSVGGESNLPISDK